MTQSEWENNQDPVPMLTFMRGKMSDRKARLFAVASARTIWDRIGEIGLKETVEIGEQLADDLLTEEDRLREYNRLCSLPKPVDSEAFLAALITVGRWPSDANFANRPFWQTARAATGPEQPHLLREIFGNPLQPVVINPSWISQEVVSLANTIYDQKLFEEMPKLAHMLRDAECDSGLVLDHCIFGEPHVRGCWVLDLLLGKT